MSYTTGTECAQNRMIKTSYCGTVPQRHHSKRLGHEYYGADLAQHCGREGGREGGRDKGGME